MSAGVLRTVQQPLRDLRFAVAAASGKALGRGPPRRRVTEAPMRIVLISDTHLAPVAKAFNDNANTALAWIDTESPDLVIHLGDVTVDAARDPVQFDHARLVLGALRAPLRVLPGNHDIGDNPPGGGVKEPAFDARRLQRFRETLGDDYWRLDEDGWTLIGLNAQLFDSQAIEEREQADWLDLQLKTAFGPIALFLHKPLFLEDPTDQAVHNRFAPPSARRWLAAAFADRDLRLIASGHVHQFRRRTIAGVEHLWTPSTAFLLPDAVQPVLGDKVIGLLTLELTPDGFTAEVKSPEGMVANNVLDHPEVYPEVAAMRRLP